MTSAEGGARFAKTEAGHAEVESRALGLTSEERRLLIVIDEHHDLQFFADELKYDEPRMARCLGRLESIGLIERERNLAAARMAFGQDAAKRVAAPSAPKSRVAPMVAVAAVVVVAAGFVAWWFSANAPAKAVAASESRATTGKVIEVSQAAQSLEAATHAWAKQAGEDMNAPSTAQRLAAQISAREAQQAAERASAAQAQTPAAAAQPATASRGEPAAAKSNPAPQAEAPRVPVQTTILPAGETVPLLAVSQAAVAPPSAPAQPVATQTASATPAPAPATPPSANAAQAVPVSTVAPASPPPALPSVAPTQVAALAPAAAAKATAIEKELAPISRETPAFPRDAIREGVRSGTVRARLAVDENGTVTNVTILQAEPRKVFDRAVTTALLRWKFNATGARGTYETEVSFSDK